jgi:hypothetical protein
LSAISSAPRTAWALAYRDDGFFDRHFGYRRRHIGADVIDALRFIVLNRGCQRVAVSIERPPAREQLEEHNAQAPNVRACVDIITAGLLRRRVRRRTKHRPLVTLRVDPGPRDPEVDDFHVAAVAAAAVVDDDIRGFDVAMQDAF